MKSTFSSTELQNAVAVYQSRREELAHEVQTAGESLAKVRSDVVEGKASSAVVIESQAAYSALAGTLEQLDAKIGETDQQLQEVRSIEERQAREQQLKALMQQIERQQDEMENLIIEGNDALAPIVNLILDTMNSQGEARREAASVAELLGSVYKRNFEPPAYHVEFGEMVWSAVQSVQQRKANQERAARLRLAAERSAEHERRQREKIYGIREELIPRATA